VGVGALAPAVHDALIGRIAGALEPFAAANAIAPRVAADQVQMVGSSGTVTTLAAVAKGLSRYDRRRVDGGVLDFATIEGLSRRLAAMDPPGRAELGCIGPERAEFVAVGCAILDGLRRIAPVGRLTVGDRGLREGILLGLMAAPRPSAAVRRRDPAAVPAAARTGPATGA